MAKTTAAVVLSTLLVTCASVFSATTYQVGPGKTFATLSAVPSLQPGDMVEVYSATYNEVKRWSDSGTAAAPITIKGMGATRPIVDATGVTVDGSLPNPRAVFQVEGSYVIIDNFELINARNGDNGSGVRVTSYSGQTTGVIVRNCYIHDNDMGIMSDTTDKLLIESCEVARNGTPAYDGFSHNFYLGGIGATVQYCYIHDSLYGQNFKTRGHYTELLYNFIANSQDGEVGLVDETVTGTANSNAVMIGNLIVAKPRLSGYNSARFVQFGQDSGMAHTGTLYCFNNTFVAGDARINFLDVNVANAAIVATNNIFYNSGTISTGNGPVSGSNNWAPAGASIPAGMTGTTFGSAPGFVNAGAGNFQLTSAAQVIDLGTGSLTYLDGNGTSHSGVPTRQYVHPLQSTARPVSGALDLGAYEFSAGGVNAAPTISSGPSATPGAVTVGQSVTFTVAASDSNGDPLTYAWAFGDGTSGSGSSVTHAYAAAGTFTASVTVSDPGGLSASGTVSVTVSSSNGGGGGGGGGTGGNGGGGGKNPHKMTVTRLQGSVNFKLTGRDQSTVSGVLPDMPAGFDPSGQVLTLNIGGATGTFTLDSHGHAKANANTFAAKVKLTRDKTTKKATFAGGDVPFTARLANGSFASLWNLDPNASATKQPLTFTVTIDVAGTPYAASVDVLYTAKAHAAGKFVK